MPWEERSVESKKGPHNVSSSSPTGSGASSPAGRVRRSKSAMPGASPLLFGDEKEKSRVRRKKVKAKKDGDDEDEDDAPHGELHHAATASASLRLPTEEPQKLVSFADIMKQMNIGSNGSGRAATNNGHQKENTPEDVTAKTEMQATVSEPAATTASSSSDGATVASTTITNATTDVATSHTLSTSPATTTATTTTNAAGDAVSSDSRANSAHAANDVAASKTAVSPPAAVSLSVSQNAPSLKRSPVRPTGVGSSVATSNATIGDASLAASTLKSPSDGGAGAALGRLRGAPATLRPPKAASMADDARMSTLDAALSALRAVGGSAGDSNIAFVSTALRGVTVDAPVSRTGSSEDLRLALFNNAKDADATIIYALLRHVSSYGTSDKVVLVEYVPIGGLKRARLSAHRIASRLHHNSLVELFDYVATADELMARMQSSLR